MPPAKLDARILAKNQKAKGEQLAAFLEAQPPELGGERLLDLWDELYDEKVKKMEVLIATGEEFTEKTSDPAKVYPYEKIRAIVGEANWKWGRMFTKWDEIERRGFFFFSFRIL